MKKRLTLSVDPLVIEDARVLAEENGTSVSSMFERFIRLLAGQRRSATTIGPFTREATGMIDLSNAQSDRKVLEDALLEKHDTSFNVSASFRRKPRD